MSALVLMLFSQFATDVFENQAAFTVLDTEEGLTFSQRPIAASPYREYRAEVNSPHPVETWCLAIFEWGTKGGDGPGIILNKVLEAGADRRVVYNQVRQSVVSNRDYALTVVRQRLADGSCRIRFRATNALAPPRPEGFVRMDKLWGEWRLVSQDGGTHVTYTLFSDPAGSVPAFLVHGGQQQATRQATRQALVKAAQWNEAHP